VGGGEEEGGAEAVVGFEVGGRHLWESGIVWMGMVGRWVWIGVGWAT